MHIHLHNNLSPEEIGSTPSELVTVDSGFTSGYTEYQFRYKNQQDTVFTLDSRRSYPNSNVQEISATLVTLYLPMRTKFQVRRRNSGGAWDSWTEFKTSDKKYSTPGAVSQLSDNTDDTAADRGSIRIVVDNHSHAQVTQTSRGATVVVNDSHDIDISLVRLADGRVVRRTTVTRKDSPPSIGSGYVPVVPGDANPIG